MDEDTFKANLKTVKELIVDENKLITYVSLSKELCIHVNEAKSLLSETIKDIRKSQLSIGIHVWYLISGLLNDNNATTTVCPESKIDILKKSLKIIFYEHVYCISAGIKSLDNVTLSAVNKFEDLPLCIGLIKDVSCTKRSDDEIGKLKSVNHVLRTESKTNVAQKIVKSKAKEYFTNGHVDKKKIPEVKSEPIIKTEKTSPKKVTSPVKGPSPKKGSTPLKKNGVKPAATKSIAGFFSKANGDTKKNKEVNTVKEESEKPRVENIKVKDEPMEIEVSKPVVKENKTTTKNSKADEKNKADSSLSKIKKNAKVDKKRKRLLRVSDSESDTEENDPFATEMAVDQESEDEIPPTPTANTVKITSGIINPKKRRKIVNKTYTDEDGYILTKKEEVYESCSENEDDMKNTELKENIKVNEQPKQIQIKTETSPKENSKGKKKKVSPPQKGTQKTMMSFFKKV